MVRWLIVALLPVLLAHGQEVTESYCKTFKPDFLEPPQSSPPPFNITANKDQYSAGVSITVTITATTALKFRGFMIQARRADPTLNQDEQIGYFSQTTETKLACLGKYGNAVVHSAEYYDVEKKTMSLRWLSGTPSQGHIRFRATVIADDGTYWVGEKSKIIYDTGAQPMPTEPPKDDPFDLTTIDVSECGKSKGCYRNPKGCTQSTCDMLVTWRDRGEYVDFEMTGDSDGWVAVGFSKDKKMGDDDVTECVWNEDKSVVEIHQSYNEEGNKKNVIIDPPDLELYKQEGYMSQGRILCSFTRKKFITGRASKFDLSYEYHILMTRGEATKDGKKKIHVLEPNKYPYVTPSKVSVTRHVDLTSTARYPLVKFHGILMIIAWMLCASTALLMAKYYKPMWPNSGLCGEKVWYAVHRALMCLVLGCTVLAFILIFVHVNGYSWMPFYHEKAHPPLGICVTILVVLNPILNICRCSPKSSYRPIFNWFHWLFGTVAAVLAMPTLFIGLNLPKAHVPWWATWVMVVYMLFHLIIELLLEIHGCINARKQKLRDEEYEIRKKNDPRAELHGRLPEPVGRRFKKRILTVYLIVTIICTLIMVIAIAIG